jgi:hypothetical protein
MASVGMGPSRHMASASIWKPNCLRGDRRRRRQEKPRDDAVCPAHVVSLAPARWWRMEGRRGSCGDTLAHP